MKSTLVLGILLFGAACIATAQDRHYWVYFTDKADEASASRVAPASCGLTPEAVERRARFLPKDAIVETADLPVRADYIDALARNGARIRVVSRWLNAVSAAIPDGAVAAIRRLPCVAGIRPVGRWSKPRAVLTPAPVPLSKPAVAFHDLDYGQSLEQLEVINVPKVHDVWIDGTGAVCGELDTGFRWREHEALKNLAVRGEYDYIFKDSVTENQAGDVYSQDEHGTLTLSTFAGFRQGTLIGPAFQAAFWLAKTEDVRSETHAEEDYWVAGLEWMESKGVIVVNSSLGYVDFDDSTRYSWANGDMNGRTAPTSIAAAHAAKLGVLVVNSMGNEGDFPGTIITPADADSIVSAGAVDFNGNLAGFSSNGPTSDGRTKPDVVAPGVRVFGASKGGDTLYFTASGTSLAAPLTSGVATLVRSARPEMTPIQARDALRNTAVRTGPPDNRYGWGEVDAWRALLYSGLVMSTHPRVFWDGSVATVACWVLSEGDVDPASVTLTYALNGGADSVIRMEFIMRHPDLTGYSGLYYARFPSLPVGASITYYISSSDDDEHRVIPYGAPAQRLHFAVGDSNTLGNEQIQPEEFRLSQGWPNPVFAASQGVMTFEYTLPEPAHVAFDLYDMYGRRLTSIVNASMDHGRHRVNVNTAALATGMYFCHFNAGRFDAVRRMVVVR